MWKISDEIKEKMQRDRDAGMGVSEIARKYSISRPSVNNYTIGHRRLKVTEEIQKSMQADRDSGMDLGSIAVKYGLSTKNVEKYTFNRSARTTPQRTLNHPITQEQLAAYRTGLRVGSKMNLLVMQYDDDGTQVGYKNEQCRIEHVSRHTVVFRRPNGRPEHRTIVELCQAERSRA